MHTSRTRFGRDIIAEFLPPAKPSRRVVILCGGLPSMPVNKRLLEFLSQRGYWAIAPRYRGSWESGGSLLAKSPHLDVLEVVAGLSRGFPDLWSGATRRITRPEVTVIGSSFGGPAALLVSGDPRVRRVVALAPVIDWRELEGGPEPVAWMRKFVRRAFGEAYRFRDSDWDKLLSGRFYDPAGQPKLVDAAKCLIMHAVDDETVPVGPTIAFTRRHGGRLALLRRGGHLSLSVIMKKNLWGLVEGFIRG